MRVLNLGAAVILPASFTAVHAARCAAPPLPLPYRNVSIVPGSFHYGIHIQVGNPPQQLALTPSLQIDNTIIPRYTNSCIHNSAMPLPWSGNHTRRGSPRGPARKRDDHPGEFEEGDKHWAGEDWWVRCAQLYGGGYVPALSSTWAENRTSTRGIEPWLQERRNFSDWKFMDETFAFADYPESYAQVTGTWPEPWNLTTTLLLHNEGVLFGGLGTSPMGLTPDSTLLSALRAADMIPSTSWSLTNSTLCLGCIDQNAHSGTYQTFKPRDPRVDNNLPCRIQALVNQLYWYPKPGVDGTLLTRQGFKACVEPGVQFLVLPEDVRSGFENATGRNVKAEYDDYLVLEGRPGDSVGMLNFRLEGGLQVNVSVHGTNNVEDKSGEWRIAIGKGGWGAYGRGVWTLGKPFTDAVVLKWDSGLREYGIANANIERKRAEVLQPLGCDKFPETRKAALDAAAGGRSADIATLVGSVIGSFVGGIVSALAGLWFYRRGGRGAGPKHERMRSQESLLLGVLPADAQALDSRRRSGPYIPSGVTAWSPLPDMANVDTASFHSISEPQLIADNTVYEAPEGGGASPAMNEERMESATH